MIPPPPELRWHAEVEIDSSSDHRKCSAEEVSMLFELRIYRTRPGQRASWVKFFEEELVPYALSKGVVVVGSFTGEQDEDQFVWIRRLDSEEDRVRAYAAVYDSDHWKNTLSPQVWELIDREQIQVIRLQPTPKSVLH
jgi:hypothetical protein